MRDENRGTRRDDGAKKLSNDEYETQASDKDILSAEDGDDAIDKGVDRKLGECKEIIIAVPIQHSVVSYTASKGIGIIGHTAIRMNSKWTRKEE